MLLSVSTPFNGCTSDVGFSSASARLVVIRVGAVSSIAVPGCTLFAVEDSSRCLHMPTCNAAEGARLDIPRITSTMKLLRRENMMGRQDESEGSVTKCKKKQWLEKWSVGRGSCWLVDLPESL